MASNIQGAVNSMIGAAGQASTLFQLTPTGQEVVARGKYNKSMAQLKKQEAKTQAGIDEGIKQGDLDYAQANRNIQQKIYGQQEALENQFINKWGSPQQKYINQLGQEMKNLQLDQMNHSENMGKVLREKSGGMLQAAKENRIMQREKLTRDKELMMLRRGIVNNEKLTPDWLKEGNK